MKHAFFSLLLLSSMASADDKANEKLLKELAGSYSVASLERGGEPASADFLKKFSSVTIKGNKLIISFKEEGKTEDKSATISVDAAKKPAHVDLKAEDGPKKDELMLGVVEIADDVVKLCWGDGPNAKRPSDATSTKENKNFLITLKRVKE